MPRKSKEQQSTDNVSSKTTVDKEKTQSQTIAMGTKHMSEVTSIIEYNDDIDTAEAPVPLPIGDYPAEIRGAEKKTGQTSGKEYVNVAFYIAPESYPADFTEGDADGVTLSYGRLSPENTTRARFQMKKFKDAIGAPGGKSLDLNDWIGLQTIVEIVHNDYEGVPQAQIKKVKPA